MKKNEVEIGGTYQAKVSDKVVDVKIIAENPYGGWDAISASSGRKVRIKSAQRLRGKAGKAKKEAKEPKADKPKAARKPRRTREGMSGLAAAIEVLKAAGEPLNAKTIVDRMLEKNLWKTGGKTPQATIYASIIREIGKLGDKARFRKSERGKFALTA